MAARIYAALGDSTGVGVGSGNDGGYVGRLYQKLRFVDGNLQLVNLCVSGATSAGVLGSQVEWVPEAPFLVTLSIGINDITRQVDPDRYAANVESILEKVQRRRPAVVVVGNLPDVSSAPSVPSFLRDNIRSLLMLYNMRIASACRARGVVHVDTFAASTALLPTRPDCFCSDGFHPSSAGYQHWADTLWPAVRDAVRDAIASTSSTPQDGR